jgi:hypothetical protein
MRAVLPAVLVAVAVLIDPGLVRAQGQASWNEAATRAALGALKSSNPRVVAHGIEALASLGNENEVGAIAAAYRRFKRDDDVRTAAVEAFSELRQTPSIAIPVLRECLDKDGQGDSSRSAGDDEVLRVVAMYGEKARALLPELLNLAEAGPITDSLGTAIARIGLTSKADADRLVFRYTEWKVAYHDSPKALQGLPPGERDSAATKFLAWTNARDAFERSKEGLEALTALGVFSPGIVDALVDMISGTDGYLARQAADTLAAILAANPAAAQRFLVQPLFPGQRDLVAYLRSLAIDPTFFLGWPRSRFDSAPIMRALVRLSKISPAAKEAMQSLVAYRDSNVSPADAASIRLEAIAGLFAADTDLSPIVLATLPLSSETVRGSIVSIDIEEQSHEVLADVLQRIGPYLAPSAPAYIRAFAGAKSSNDQRMLAWALSQMLKGASSSTLNIPPLFARTTDPQARALLLAAYLNGGGGFAPVLDVIAKPVHEEPGSATVRTAVGKGVTGWEAAGYGPLAEAIMRRKDFRWHVTPTGQSVLAAFIADENEHAGGSVPQWAKFVPFGPLSLEQSLLILEGRTRDGQELDDPAYWAAFLCPNSGAEIDLGTRLLLNRPAVASTKVEDLRPVLPQLVALLDAAPRDGELQYRVVRALTQAYGAGVSQWTSADRPQLVAAAKSLESYGERVSTASRGFGPGTSREDALRAARSIRDRLGAAEDVEVAVRRTEEVQRQAAVDRQAQERARRRLIALSGGLTVALALGFTVVLSVSLRRKILLLAGRRWCFVATECDGTLEVSRSQAVFRPTTGPRPVLAAIPAEQWPPRDIDLAVIKRELKPRWTIRILADEAQFRRPWSHLVGSPWSEGPEAVVAGQLCLASPDPDFAPDDSKTIVFASYACADSPGLPLLPSVASELASVERSFRRWGATIRCRTTDARRNDVVEGLQAAEIVHVAAHSTPGAIYLKDGPLDHSVLTSLCTQPLRCRLLVLSSCEAGRLDQQGSLVYHLVRRGVNVVASLAPVNDDVCVMFFEDFYAALLPSRAAQGIDLGASIRLAAASCKKRLQEMRKTTPTTMPIEQWMATVDSFALYGDPTIQLRLTSPGKPSAAPSKTSVAAS